MNNENDSCDTFDVFPIFVVLSLLVLAAVMIVSSCDSEKRRGLPDWTIVKQRTNETFHLNNYGYVNVGGGIIAGFTNINDAKAAMKNARWYWNHRTEPEPEKPKSMWEIVK